MTGKNEKEKKSRPRWEGHRLKPGYGTGTLKRLKDELDALFDHLLAELDPCKQIRQIISWDGNILRCAGEEVPLRQENRIIAVGSGKASHRMAAALHEIFGERVHGLVNIPGDLGKLAAAGKIEFQPAGHPNPDEGSVRGAQAIIKLLEEAGPQDIIFALISGGGSALLELPVPGISLADYIRVNELLNRTGVGIEKWNTVRKHLSSVKGGRLAQRATHSQRIFNLMVSDVRDDRPDLIASGPFVRDSSTFADAYRILMDLVQKSKGPGDEVPAAVIDYFRRNRGIEVEETFETGTTRVINVMVAGSNTAVDLSVRRLQGLGIPAGRIQCLRHQAGDVEEVTGKIYTSLAKQVNRNPGMPAAVVAGGEATVDVTHCPGFQEKKSFGGRMQMMAAIMMTLLENLPVAGLFAATDCRDGKPPPGKLQSAGALIDGTTLNHARRCGIAVEQYLSACNTYELHERLSTQLRKEQFITNVTDLAILVYRPYQR
jgi:glycerate 2-kinase